MIDANPSGKPDAGAPATEFVSQLTRYQPDIWAYLLGLMPGHPDVSDVLQKTNLVLWNKRESFELGSNFRAWALTVARYEVMAHLKSQRRRPVFVFDDALIETLASEGPADMGDSSCRLEALETCLHSLRKEDRELLEHRYQRQGGLDDFARRCGRSVSALSVSLFRLRTALRRCVVQRLESQGGAS